MSEYIDKRKLLSALNDKCYDMSMPANYYAGFQYAVKIIEKLNVKEEVAPLVHGEWMRYSRTLWHYCSVCLEDALMSKSTGTEVLSSFCPHCGAKMD